MLGGEGLNDPNFDFKNVEIVKEKLNQWHDFAINNYQKKAKNEKTPNDPVFLSYVNKYLKQGTEYMENMLFRNGFDKLFFQLQKVLREYIAKGKTNPVLINEFIILQTKVLHPFCPHITEEIFEKLGNKEFISLSSWPKSDESKINEKYEMQEKQIENLSEDINNIIKLVKEKQGKDIKIAYLYSIPSELLTYKESIELLKKKTEIDIKLFAVNDKNKYDPENKAPKAKPGKPGIFVE
jgi:leucyl-tRNA synthetase